MAEYSKITDIRDKRLGSGEVLDDSLVVDIDSIPGMTDELAAEALLAKYPYDFPGVESSSFTIPTMDAMISSLPGISGENKYEDFIKNFPVKRKEWEAKIKSMPQFGERGWKHLTNLWKQASIDKMNAEILKQRDYALHGMDENGEIVRPLDYAAGKVADFFTPRRMRAYMEGREPTDSETFMDFAQNAAYMVPMGGIEAAIARGTGRAALGALGGAAVAPSVIVASDYGLGTKDYAGAADALLDAGVGTATNLGVNKVIAPVLGAAINLGKSRGVVPKVVRDFLDNNTSSRDKALNLVKEANRKLKAHAAETNADYAKKLQEGKPTDRLSPDELKRYRDILDLSKQSKNAEVRKQFTEGWNEMIKRSDAIKNTKFDGYNGYLSLISKKPNGATVYRGVVPEAKRPLSELIDDATNGIDLKGKQRLVENPELISLFKRTTPKEYVKAPSTYTDIMKSYVINQIGDDAAAQRVLARMGVDVKDIRKAQDTGRRERKASVAASDILKARKDTLSPESIKYINMIKENPSIIVTGISDPVERDSFNMWLLREGNEILRGTAASRPTWEVK